MPRKEVLVQLSDELLAALDARRAQDGRSRSDLIREAIHRHLSDDPEGEIDRLIVEAYTRQPPAEDWGAAAARQLIAAEPWE